MGYFESEAISITTDASGDATGVSRNFNGTVHEIRYDGGFDATADFTITLAAINVWTESNVTNSATKRLPRQATHDGVGVASLYAGSGEPVEDSFVAANEELAITIAQGGNAKTGILTLVIEGSFRE